jgi:predicted kinase
MKLLIVAGLPATGKSTIAKKLGVALGLPILEKDEIKEELFDTVGYADLAQKRALDNAACAILLRCAEPLLQSGYSLILVNNFNAEENKSLREVVDRCGCQCITVFLSGDPDVLWKRYVERDKNRTRHMGHTFIDRYPPKEGDDIYATMPREYFAERFERQGMGDFNALGESIVLDATDPATIDVNALIAKVRELIKN